MDQVYLPRNRQGFPLGGYVVVKPLESMHVTEKPHFYGIKEVAPLKLGIVQEIFALISRHAHDCENVLITGSFLEEGFSFQDIDVLIITDKEMNEKSLQKAIESSIKIEVHLLVMSHDALLKGLATDPLYHMMLSKAVAKKRFIYHVEREVDYKLLDLHLLKSRVLIDNFDSLNGNEKYSLVRNMVAIFEFIKGEKLRKEHVDKEIESIFQVKVFTIRQNVLDKKTFLREFRGVYQKTLDLILEGIRHDSKQKQAH